LSNFLDDLSQHFKNIATHFPSIDQIVDPDNVSKFTRFDYLYKSFKNLVDSDPKRISSLLAQCGNPFYQKNICYSEITPHIYKAGSIYRDNRGLPIIFSEDRVLYTLNDFSVNGEDSYEMEIFVDGKKIDSSEFSQRDFSGGKRFYIKLNKQDGTPLIKNNTTVQFVAHQIYDIGLRYEKVSVPVSSGPSSFSFNVNLVNIGKKHFDLTDFAIYRKRAGCKFPKRIFREENYIISYLDQNKQTINILILDSVNFEDTFYILNTNSYFKTNETVNTQIEIDETLQYRADKPFNKIILLRKIDDELIPYPIFSSQDIIIYVNGYRLIYEKDYTVAWNDYNDDFPPILVFRGLLPIDSVITIIKRDSHKDYFDKTIYLDEIDEHGIIDLTSFNFPISTEYVEFFLNRKRVPSTQVENITSNIIRLKNVTSRSNLMVRSHFVKSELSNAFISLYDNYRLDPTVNDLTKFVKLIGFQTFLQNYLVNNPDVDNEHILPIVDTELIQMLPGSEIICDPITFMSNFNNKTLGIVYKETTADANILREESLMGDYPLNANNIFNDEVSEDDGSTILEYKNIVLNANDLNL
jgi:hypothetical protein